MRYIIVMITIVSLLGCVQTKTSTTKYVARVYDEKLTEDELLGELPQNLTEEDSLAFAKKYIKNWVKKSLFYQKATLNLNNPLLDKMIKDYQEDLYISYYKNLLVNQNLDTVVSQNSISNFYEENKNNFKLKEVLVKLKYIHLENNTSAQKEIKEMLLSEDEQDKKELLGRFTETQDFFFKDSAWVSLQDIYARQPKFPKLSSSDFSKKNKILQKQGVQKDLYYVVIKDVLYPNDIAPLDYVVPTIKSILLHQNKNKYFDQMEQILINDAVKQGEYEVY